MWRVVMRPWLLRPPVLEIGRSRDFSGVERVISSNMETELWRRPGVVGLYLRIAIVIPYLSTFLLGACAEDVDGVAALTESHVGALGGLTDAEAGTGALALALAVSGVHGVDLHAEDLLDGIFNLGLVGIRCNVERVNVLDRKSTRLNS